MVCWTSGSRHRHDHLVHEILLQHYRYRAFAKRLQEALPNIRPGQGLRYPQPNERTRPKPRPRRSEDVLFLKGYILGEQDTRPEDLPRKCYEHLWSSILVTRNPSIRRSTQRNASMVVYAHVMPQHGATCRFSTLHGTVYLTFPGVSRMDKLFDEHTITLLRSLIRLPSGPPSTSLDALHLSEHPPLSFCDIFTASLSLLFSCIYLYHTNGANCPVFYHRPCRRLLFLFFLSRSTRTDMLPASELTLQLCYF